MNTNEEDKINHTKDELNENKRKMHKSNWKPNINHLSLTRPLYICFKRKITILFIVFNNYIIIHMFIQLIKTIFNKIVSVYKHLLSFLIHKEPDLN